MEKIQRAVWTMVLAVIVFGISPVMALAPEYERNGECYLLIGDGTKQGVYRLNNPSGEGGVPFSGTVPLYSPGSSYGISVNLNRHVFTFTENVGTGYVAMPGNISVRMKADGQDIMRHFHCEHRTHWGEAGWPVYTTSGPMANYPGYFSATAQPWGWTMSRSVGSCCGCGAPKTPISFNVYRVSTVGGYGSIPNNSWYQSIDNDRSGRPGKHYRDRVEGKAHTYNLLEWWAGISGNNPTNQGAKATSYEKRIARAMLGSCIDPCGTDQLDLTQDAEPQYVSLALSSLGRTYCYTRTQSSTSDGKITLDNAAYTGNIIPTNRLNDLSTQWVGCSLRNSSADYIYVLGTQVIRDWLTSQGVTIPGGFKVTAVTVSDQWYQNGGIVFGYDNTSGMAYQFTRRDVQGSGAEGTIDYFRGINLGTGIDDLKSDGFGNMYFGKTAKFPDPSKGSFFTTGEASGIQWTSVSTSSGIARGRIIFDQKVTKSVYRLGLGATSENLVNSVILGYDKWEQFFQVPLTIAGVPYSTINHTNYTTYSTKPGFIWLDTAPKKDPTPSVGLPTRVQLGVINVATPPKVYKMPGSNGNIDIAGPMSYPTWLTGEKQEDVYTFSVENTPVWERDDWNKKYYDPANLVNITDSNGNSFLGGFNSTVSKSGAYPSSSQSDHVLYDWVVYKIQDEYGVPLPKTVFATSGGYQVKPYLSLAYTAGVYQIECRSRFRWYNYDALPFGSTAADKPSCLTGWEDAKAPPVPGTLTSANYPGLVEPIPANTAVQILKVKTRTTPPVGTLNAQIRRKDTTGAVYTPPSTSPSGDYFVIDEKKPYHWKIFDSTGPTSPVNKQYDGWKLYCDPSVFVTDPNKVAGSVRWEGTARYTWTFKVMLPGNNPNNRTCATIIGNSTAPTFAHPALDPASFGVTIPTDPVLGTLICDAVRSYSYTRQLYDSNGYPTDRIDVPGLFVRYYSEVKVLVKDLTAPEIISFNGLALGDPGIPVLRGQTGELLTAGGLGNPTELKIVVRDNNPFANDDATMAAIGGVHNRQNRQMATILYETTASKNRIPYQPLQVTPNLATATVLSASQTEILYYSSPGAAAGLAGDDVVNTKFRLKRSKRTVPAGSLFSELEYTLAIGDIKHFQGTGGTGFYAPAALPIGFANNHQAYNLNGYDGYMIRFQAQDSSGNQAGMANLTRMDVVDNKPPSIWIDITDMKTNQTSTVPSGLATISTRYDLLKIADPWEANGSGLFSGFVPAVYGNPRGTLTSLAGISPLNPPLIEDGVEVVFSLSSADNIGVATSAATFFSPYFKITGPDSGSVYYKAGTNPVTVPGTPVAPPALNPVSYRYIFRDPGVYLVELYCEDTALTFAKAASHNRRNCRFNLIVVPTTMDVRVIDRDSNRR